MPRRRPPHPRRPAAAAVDAFTHRSDPALLPRLNVLLGALTTRPGNRRHGHQPTSDRPDAAITGTGAHARLRPEYTRTTALPARITAYATTGRLPTDTTWPSHSEARQSVLAHAALHGHSLATITRPDRPRPPLASRIGRRLHPLPPNADTALTRDFHKALTWAATNTAYFRPIRAQDQELHTRGGGKGPELHRRWLANALAWLDSEYPGHRYRWIGAAIYQALAIHAVRAGEVINGVPVVGVGGTFAVDCHGAAEPRPRSGNSCATPATARLPAGPHPHRPRPRTRLLRTDPTTRHDPCARCIAATRVEDVHPAWKIIGHRHRRIYELIVHHQLDNPADVFAAAHVGSSSGYTTLAALATAGLITRDARPPHTGTDRPRRDRRPRTISTSNAHNASQRHQRERAGWHDWLQAREDARRPRDTASPQPLMFSYRRRTRPAPAGIPCRSTGHRTPRGRRGTTCHRAARRACRGTNYCRPLAARDPNVYEMRGPRRST